MSDLAPVTPTDDAIAEGARRLRAGQLVAFPTETVYGLGANALDADAVARIYAAKGRPAWNPVIVHVATVEEARTLARNWPPAAEALAHAFWPGPLTLVVPRSAAIPAIVAAGGETVGVRVPAHPVAQALLAAAGIPVAAPSANRFTAVSPTTAAHVVASLGARAPFVLDGGPCPVGIESTVVDCTEGRVRLLRPGMIDRTMLAAVVAPLGMEVEEPPPQSIPQETPEVAGAGEAGVRDRDAGRAAEPVQRSPGMAERHYAPRAEVWLVDPAAPGEALEAAAHRVGSVRVEALWRTLAEAPAGVRVRQLPREPAAYARALYAALHAADADGTALLLIELPPVGDPAWTGIRDRLTRAAR